MRCAVAPAPSAWGRVGARRGQLAGDALVVTDELRLLIADYDPVFLD
ncbi:hypothetical protein HGI15_21445 [Modestobacter lapidis]|nr:hypothetical protein [Modestobacter lapidis]